MSSQMAQLQEATIKAQCKALRMPMIASQFGTLAEQAIREKKSHIGYLEALLLAEIEERERNTIERRIREAHLPRLKTLEEFDYTQSPNVTAAKMRDLAEGGYIERAEPVLFIGECGTGKTHLLTGLCVAACRQKRRVRFTTAAGLGNELVGAKHQLQLRRVMARWSRYDLIAIDAEVGYVPLVCVDGKPEHLSVSSVKIAALPGAGGLQILRLEYQLSGPQQDPKPGVSHRLQYQDTNHQDRIGWREIVVAPGPNISVFDSSAFNNSVSNELRTYPVDMLASPLNEDRADLSWT